MEGLDSIARRLSLGQTLIDCWKVALTILGMNNTPCTLDQQVAIIRAAAERARFLRWIAEKLLVTDDIHIRREAARALLQLTEGQ
jgi:hypothetical protein